MLLFMQCRTKQLWRSFFQILLNFTNHRNFHFIFYLKIDKDLVLVHFDPAVDSFININDTNWPRNYVSKLPRWSLLMYIVEIHAAVDWLFCFRIITLHYCLYIIHSFHCHSLMNDLFVSFIVPQIGQFLKFRPRLKN